MLAQEKKNILKQEIRKRGISHLVHFTPLNNLNSILRHGLLPITELKKRNIPYISTDPQRIDGYSNAVCLSISFPNYLMFYSVRQKYREREWAILLLKPDILWEKDCAFNWKNASCKEISRIPIEQMKTLNAFFQMFDNEHGIRDLLGLPDRYTTDPQAEVFVFDRIEQKYIEFIVFEDCWPILNIDLTGLDQKVLIKQDLLNYQGLENDYFGPRFDYWYWSKSNGVQGHSNC
ncbi:DarT ssDNA thymidine ADP-ribosyltransferase family protein [Fervidobacterium sp.]